MNARNGPLRPVPTIPRQGDRPEDTTAKQRASALAVDLSAVAAGIWPPTPSLFDALANLASATAWDLCVLDDMVPA